ncbi:Gfo/Idh/MocA family protein [Actinomadura kijaniata]|uniref:Gfo/Idh/MocA family protein n=1 Tax=Actinomadura kijaniata TaxID=46161 RepID=UPI003F1BC49A
MHTDQRIRLGVVGLGAMGRAMLDAATDHPDVDVVLAADPSPAAVERSRAAHPHLAFTGSPERALTGDGVDAVYIASPPAAHARQAVAAMRAGRAVFCEKPLAVDLDEGAEMVAAAETSGVANALNFVLSDRRAAVKVLAAVRAGEAGEVLGVEMRFAFPEWPRAFQRDAAWVAGPAQGGFLREVASHFVFLTDRLLGPLDVADATVDYSGAERFAAATLRAGGVPVRLSGQVAAVPESYEWTLYGSRRSYRITGWSRLETAGAHGWTPVPVDDGPHGDERARLAEFARAVRGETTTLADFAAGLRVQRVIETLHLRNREQHR